MAALTFVAQVLTATVVLSRAIGIMVVVLSYPLIMVALATAFLVGKLTEGKRESKQEEPLPIAPPSDARIGRAMEVYPRAIPVYPAAIPVPVRQYRTDDDSRTDEGHNAHIPGATREERKALVKSLRSYIQ